MSDLKINSKIGEFNFLMYDDEDEVWVSDQKSPYDHGISIPIDKLVKFRDALNNIIEEQNRVIDRERKDA